MIVLICGLMQSGKTTVLSAVARTLVNHKGLRVSALVSGGRPSAEIARGVRSHALQGSCVSCQLGAVLAETVQAIRSQEQPDVTLVELPAAAEVDAARQALLHAPGLREQTVCTLVVVDACAPAPLHRALDHMFTALVLASDVLVLNRADRCSVAAVDALLAEVSAINPGIRTARMRESRGAAQTPR